MSVLLGHFGDRLRFPVEFVGRGDVSRGGLLLRCARDGQELEYADRRCRAARRTAAEAAAADIATSQDCRIAELS